MNEKNLERIEIRQLVEEDLDQALRLSSFAFQFEVAEADWERTRSYMQAEHEWGAFIDGKLATKVGIIPLTAYINGVRYAMGGVAGVASWPEYRRNGFVSKLLTHSLKVMKEAGQSISFLAPFSFAFYRRYGWETYVDRKKLTIESYFLPKIQANEIKGSVDSIGEDIAVLSPLYERYAERYNGTLSRTDKWWQDKLFPNRKGQIAVYTDAAGEKGGYIHYQVKNRVLTVHELVALNHEARKALWRFISMHDSMIERVIMYAPENDNLAFELDNPRIKQEIEPYFMARIVDVASFCRQYRFVAHSVGNADYAAASSVSIRFHIKDEYAPWNNGRFGLTVKDDGTAEMVRKTEEEGRLITASGNPDEEICCTIQTLTTLMMGYRNAEQLHELGRLEGNAESIQLLSAIIPRSTTYLSDFF